MLFYAAGEAVLGVATGVLVEHANDVPEDERAGAASVPQELWDNFITADLFAAVGSVAWAVAVFAAAVAYRHVGAPIAASILLALSALTLLHAPPTGPVGLLFFAAAVALLAWSQRAATGADRAVPALADRG